MQTNLYKGQASALVMSAPDQSMFMRPMSYGARDTLSGLLEWASKHAMLFGGPRPLMIEFTKRFNQLRYEEVEQMYHADHFVKIVVGTPGVKGKNGVKPKTAAEALDILSLDKLLDTQWVHERSIPSRNRIGDISQTADLYYWLVEHFLYGDFPSTDLGKIAEMGRTCRLDTVKREAQQIVDNDKHSIAYLYAVVRGVTSRDEMIKRRESVEDQENLKKLAALGSLAIDGQNKVSRTVDESVRRSWELEREFAELARDLKNND